MAKYRGSYLDEEDDKTYAQEMQEMQEQHASGEEDDETGDQAQPADPEESSFKKRYGDLRRHMQQKEQEHQRQIKELKQQLDEATKQQIRFPKTDEEIEEWSKKYPDVAQIVDTIARKRANEVLEQGKERFQDLDRLEQRIQKKEAEATLLDMHPDFVEIRKDKKFHDWAQEQPQWIINALYHDLDPYSAAKAIDLYKYEHGIKSKDSRKKDSKKEAASSVDTRSRGEPETAGGPSFSESQVDKMSDAEYEKNEAAILDAMRNGRFTYDLTGGAR